MIAVVSAASFIASCSGKDGARSARDARRYIAEHNLKTLPRSDIPLVVNDRVVAWMEYFQGPGRRHFERYLARSGRYIPVMQKILKEQGMPKDLVYIALIESGFNDTARSHANAVGAWQFIRSTGNIYGLKTDGWIDERRDPIKATYAAAGFFRDLHDEFGDWYLAMAGYNAGPGRVRQAIASTGSRDFWGHAEDRHALRAETRDYVPKYIAATIMAKDPQRFGFRDIDYEDPLDFDIARVDSQTDISVIAKCAGAPEEEVARLNAHLVRGATPPAESNYAIKLPRGTAENFKVAYAQIPEEERIKVVRHNVGKGDTLTKIARRYGVSSRKIASANGIGYKSHLRPGQTLIIPVGSYAARFASYDDGGSAGGSGGRSVTRYKVKKGDTLGGIASRHRGVTVAKLRSWNGLGSKSHIRAGQVLKIYGKGAPAKQRHDGSSDHYTVKKGDTAGGIAARAGVSTKQLMAMNNIKDPRRLKVGQRLVLSGQGPAKTTESSGDARQASRQSGGTHTVRSGETVGGIAGRYGMGAKELMALNNIKNPRSLKAGAKLKVNSRSAAAEPKAEVAAPIAVPEAVIGPVSDSEMTAAAGIDEAAAPSEVQAQKIQGSAATAVAKSAPATHRLKAGETLGHVAERYGVSTKNLMAWNNIRDPRKVRAGRNLVIRSGAGKSAASAKPETVRVEPMKSAAETPIKLSDASAPSRTSAGGGKTINHTVKNGETLWTIARMHSVTISQLQEWNSLDDPSAVRAGTTLRVIKN